MVGAVKKVLCCFPRELKVLPGSEQYCLWENVNRQPDIRRACEEMYDVIKVLQGFGVEVDELPAQIGLVDQTFMANVACRFVVSDTVCPYRHVFVLANLAPPHRQEEVNFAANWLLEHAYIAEPLPEDILFEGQADIMEIPGLGYIYCYGIRNGLKAKLQLERLLKLENEIIGLELVNPWWYHRDMCVRYSEYRNELWYIPAAFSKRSLEIIESWKKVVNLYVPPKELWVQETPEGRNFPLNGINVGRNEIFPWNTRVRPFPPDIAERIRKSGGNPVFCKFDQFGLAGGSIGCCFLILERSIPAEACIPIEAYFE